MLEKRTSPRRKMVLPVKVTVDNGSYLAHTVDITQAGARFGALRTQMQPGIVVTLQRGLKKAQFRIAWVRQLSPNELQAGVEALEPRSNFWGVDFSAREREAKKDMEALMSILSDSPTSALRPKEKELEK